MRVVVLKITKKSAAGNAFQESRLQVDELGIGRGSDQGVRLPDLHAALEHAVLKQGRGNKFLVTSRFHGGIRVNGEACQHAEISFGDIVTVGNTDILLRKPPPGADITLEVDEAGAREYAATHTTRINLGDAGMRKRPLAWAGFLLVLLLAFIVPQLATDRNANDDVRRLAHPALDSWSSGPLSTVHANLPDDCLSCHDKPFERVKESACLECHENVEEHATVDADSTGAHPLEIGRSDCTSCHTEHEGMAGIISMPDNLCVDCHSDPERGMNPGRHGSGIHHFAEDHPDFRIGMQIPSGNGWSLERVEYTDDLQEQSRLIFPHDAHLDPAGVQGPDGDEVLECKSCHVPDSAGVGMQPIRMEENCQRCHELSFDPNVPERTLPHGDLFEVQASLQDFYARIALQGGYAGEDAPDFISRRRAPGKELEREEARAALGWAEQKAAEVTAEVIEVRVCNTCHEVQKVFDQWRVKGVKLTQDWLPPEAFSHADHETEQCVDCHAAESSAEAGDILVPHIENCTECHDDRPGKTIVNSQCSDCHGFHGSSWEEVLE